MMHQPISTATGGTTNGSTTLTSTASVAAIGWAVNQPIFGPNVPLGDETYCTTNGTATITFPSSVRALANPWQVGMGVFGTDFAPGTTVSSIAGDGLSALLSSPPTRLAQTNIRVRATTMITVIGGGGTSLTLTNPATATASGQTYTTNTPSYTLAYSRLTNPQFDCGYGFAPRGLWIEEGFNNFIDGGYQCRGGALGGIRLGTINPSCRLIVTGISGTVLIEALAGYSSLAASGTTTNASATVTFAAALDPRWIPGMVVTGVGVPVGDTIVSIAGDRLSLVLSTAATASGTNSLTVSAPTQSDPSSVGFEWYAASGGQCTDNTINDNMYISGYRKGYVDNGGNNGGRGEWHVVTGGMSGYLERAYLLRGGSWFAGRIFVDSPWMPAGLSAIGVDIDQNGAADQISSTVNPSVGTLDNQVTLIRFRNTGTEETHIASVQSFSSYGIKFTNVVDSISGLTSLLKINNITGDGNWYTLGYITSAIQLTTQQAADGAFLQGATDQLTAAVPGAPWTPAQIASSLAIWLDAKQVPSITVDGNGRIIQWASRVRTVTAVQAPASTSPIYSPTGWDGVALPGITFNGIPSGDLLDLGPSTAMPAGNDIAVFVAIKRGIQDTTDATTRRVITCLNSNYGSSTILAETSFYNKSQKPAQTEVRVDTIGGGSGDMTSLGENQAGIVEGFYTTSYTPVGSSGTGTSGSLIRANTQSYTPSTYSFAMGASTQRNTLGGGEGLAVARTAMTIAEVIVVVGVLTNTNRQKIEGYLAWKWFGSGSGILPTSHPYYAAAPSILRQGSVISSGASYNISRTERVTIVNKTTGSATQLNLPSNSDFLEEHRIIDGKGDAGVNNITITPATGFGTLINGSANYILNINYGQVVVTSDGTNWFVK